MRGLLRHWTKSSIIPSSKGESVWRNKSTKRGPVPSRKTDRLLDLRILPGHWGQWFCRELCRPIDSCSSKWWYSGIWFKMGRNSIVDDTNPIWWHLGMFGQIKNTRVWQARDRIRIVQYGESSEEGWTWLSQIEDNGRKKVSSRIWEWRILKPEMEILKQAPWSRIREQNSVNKDVEIVGNGKLTGSVQKETIAVSDTIRKKRAKSTQPNPSPGSSTQESVKNASRTRGLRGRSPSVKMARLPCKDYLKGTCTPPFCEKWHPPQCLFCKSEKRMQIWGKVFLRTPPGWRTASRSLKRMVTEVQWLYWRIHDNWVAYVKIWSRRSPQRFCERAQTY